MNECEIYINNIEKNLSEFYNFPKNGTYFIKFKFNILLSSTKKMFFNCDSIKSFDLSNFNTQNVRNMRDMFSGCNFLTNINLSNFNTQNARKMSYMFNGCNSLTNLNLSNINTQSVKSMRGMFNGCNSLTKKYTL